MRTDEMALSYLRRAESRLTDAKAALERKSFPDVVRYSQEAVEMSLKAVLRGVGIEYPKDHEVSTVLASVKDRLPIETTDRLEELSEISSKLYDARGPAMYGDEDSGTPPEEIFKKEDAEKSLKQASTVYKVSKSSLGNVLEKDTRGK